jgi:outer membrane protein OmpA-like peptidoglycan-associated protein
MLRSSLATALFGALVLSATPSPAFAQLPSMDRLRKTVNQAVEDEILNEADRLARTATRCVFDDLECIRKANEGNEEVVLTNSDGELILDDDGRPVTSPDNLPPGYETTSETPGASSNYDFVAGERVLFEDDFADENQGDFPRTLEFMRGNMEVVTMDDGRPFLRGTSDPSQFAVVLPAVLPDQFTIEFDIHDVRTEGGTWVTTEEPNRSGQTGGNVFNFGHWRGSGIWDPEGEPLSSGESELMEREIVTARIMADGEHVKAYINEVRVSNVPRVELARTDRIYFSMSARDDRPIYLSNIRVAAGGRDLYEALSTDGRVEVHDILFDTGSDVIRPESFPVLEEIGTMLRDHADLALMVEGHTDNEGDFDANMQLSDARAASVKVYLLETFGIEESRLRTMGLGSTRPVDTNDTPEGRQRNRRVELVRM